MAKLPKGLKKRSGGWYHLDFMWNGQRVIGSCKTKSLYVAEKLLQERREQLALGHIKDDRKKQGLLFKVALDDFILRKKSGWKPQTLGMHHTSYPKLVAFFGEKFLHELTIKDVEYYRTARQDGKVEWMDKRSQQMTAGKKPSNATLNRELSTFRQLLDDHNMWLNLKQNTKFKMLKENRDVGQPLTTEEFLKLVDACQKLSSKVVYPAFMFAILTGIRKNELKQLTWEKVNLLEGTIRISRDTTKTSAGVREIPIDEMAMDLLRNWRSNFVAEPHHYVFCSQKYTRGGKPGKCYPDRPYVTWDKSWIEAKKAAGVTCRWHDLRHSCASVVGKNASRATLKRLMGWMSDAMLDRYCHSELIERQEAMESVGAHFHKLLNHGSESIQ